MRLINEIDNQPNQNHKLVLNDGTVIDFTLKYFRNQKGWFYSLTYGTAVFNNRRLVTSPNMLRQFKNIIPFGLACTTSDGLEPIFIDDFKDGRAKLYLLDADEVVQVEEEILFNE